MEETSEASLPGTSSTGGRQLYSKKFSKKCSRLLAKAHDFVESMEELGTEALPPDHHGLQPLVLVLIVSPMEGNKVSSYVGSALANEAPFQAVVQATANTMVACQHAKGLAAKACADAGQPIKPPQQQTKGPRSEYHAKQLRFAVYWRKELKGKLPDPKKKRGGFTLHTSAEDCLDGCSECNAARDTLGWPARVTLLQNPANYSKENFGTLLDCFSIPALAAGNGARSAVEERVPVSRSSSMSEGETASVQYAAAPSHARLADCTAGRREAERVMGTDTSIAQAARLRGILEARLRPAPTQAVLADGSLQQAPSPAPRVSPPLASQPDLLQPQADLRARQQEAVLQDQPSATLPQVAAIQNLYRPSGQQGVSTGWLNSLVSRQIILPAQQSHAHSTAHMPSRTAAPAPQSQEIGVISASASAMENGVGGIAAASLPAPASLRRAHPDGGFQSAMSGPESRQSS